MADAGKCHINIPYKEWAKQLAMKDGKLDQASLARAAGQEFENLKTIERHLNDPDCAEGCTSTWAHIEASGASNTVSINNATSGSLDLTWGNIVEESGGWTISGGKIIPPDTSLLYHVYLLGSLVQGTGTDPVMAQIQLLDNVVTWYGQSCYIPTGFDGQLTMGRLADMDSRFSVSLILTSPTLATRSFHQWVELFVISTCSKSPYQ